MSRRRASSVDQAGSTTATATTTTTTAAETLLLQHSPFHHNVQSISEDDESEEYDYEYTVDVKGFDESSSNSSSEPSPPFLKSTMSLDGGSFHGTGNSGLFYDTYRAPLHNDLRMQDRLSVSSGAATIAAIPSSSSSKAAAASRYCNTLVFTARRRKNPFLFSIITGFTLLGVVLYTKSYAALHNALEQVTILTQQRNQVRKHFSSVEADIQRLQRQLLELDQGAVVAAAATDEGNEGGESTPASFDTTRNGEEERLRESIVDEMVALQEKLREGNSQIGSLQKHLQVISRQDAMQKYGSGVIRVKLELEFPETNEKLKAGANGPNVLIFEMAPLDLMPHSVYMFLEMVHAGLFDGCSFILNAMHVIKAAPLPYDGSSASQKVKAFTKLGLESVAFREYSPDYPHEQYTVGFAADGSPSFYINTQDNSELHVGEPCFAKVVSGFDTVARLEAAPTRNGIFYRRRIGLKKVVIL